MLVALLFVRPVPSSGSAGRHGESGMIWDGTVLQVQSIVEGSGYQILWLGIRGRLASTAACGCSRSVVPFFCQPTFPRLRIRMLTYDILFLLGCQSETRKLSTHIRLSLVKLGLLAWRLAEDRDPQSSLAKTHPIGECFVYVITGRVLEEHRRATDEPQHQNHENTSTPSSA